MKKTLLVLALAVFAAAAISGCKRNNDSSSAVPAGGIVTASSAASGLASQQADPSSAPASSDDTHVVTPGEPASSQNGPVIDIQTDNKEFDAKFKQNPIDKSYISESAAAVSNVDMVNVSNKYAGVWQKEIDNAWSGLQKYMKADSSTRPAALKAEQQKWEDGKAAALQKITDDAQAAGGSMAQVDASSKTMDFYRSRANQLYRELYSYNKNYAYAWKSN